MKLVLQAIVGSIAIHIIYIVGMMIVSYIKTITYKPDLNNVWDNVDTLQKEVVLGKVNSPFIYIYRFIAIALICGIIIFSYRKLL